MNYSRSIRSERCLSSFSDSQLSKMVTGLNSDRVKADAKVSEYLAANFVEDIDEKYIVVTKDDAVKEVVLEKDANELLNIHKMSCHTRCRETEDGSRASRSLRKSGLIPGVIYGGDMSQGIHHMDEKFIHMVKTPQNQIYSAINKHGHKAFESRVYDLTVEETGEVHRVLPRGLQMHPLKEKIICLNFIRYYPGRPIKIPILPINQEDSPAMKRGGFIVWQNRHLECIVDEGVPIPEHIELECTGLERKMVLRLERLALPEGVKVSPRLNSDKWLLGSVFGKAARDELP